MVVGRETDRQTDRLDQPDNMAVVQHHNETRFLDETTLETLSYLESRVLRLEHILYGHTIPQAKTQALPSLQQLEHRFAQLLKRVRTYDELLKICMSQSNCEVACIANPC